MSTPEGNAADRGAGEHGAGDRDAGEHSASEHSASADPQPGSGLPGPGLPVPGSMEPAAGRLLIAMPMLTDPNFAHSIVYLLEHDPEAGCAGVVINSPSRTPVGTVLPEWQDAVSDPGVVFRGGPVQPKGALCLAELPAPDDLVPVPGVRAGRHRVGLVDLDTDATVVRAGVSGLRIYAGHSGWSAGQLENEIAEGAWIVVPGESGDVFAADPTRLWHQVLSRQAMPLRLMATYGGDVGLN